MEHLSRTIPLGEEHSGQGRFEITVEGLTCGGNGLPYFGEGWMVSRISVVQHRRLKPLLRVGVGSVIEDGTVAG